jgi:hypothetical protein
MINVLFLMYRPRLLKFLRRRQKEKECRHRYLTLTYNKYMNEWLKRVGDLEKIANGPISSAQSATNSVGPGGNASTTSAATTTASTTAANASSTAPVQYLSYILMRNLAA